MTGAGIIQRTARNNAWANARLHALVCTLSDEEFAAHRAGFFPSLRATLNHILGVDNYYVHALEGASKPYSELPEPDHASPQALAAAQAAMDRRLIRFCDGVDDARLDSEVETARSGGTVSERVGDLLMHLFQHQIHHRGQAHNMLSQGGFDPPQLDEFHLGYERHPSAAQFDGARP